MDYNILCKRLLYKSANRGWKETDFLLGEFAKKNITKMNEKQLHLFDKLLDEADADVFNWITKKTAAPKEHDNEVLLMLQNFLQG